MNKKGFTLVELLGVIVVLAILSGLVVVSMSGVIGTGKLSVYKTYEKSFKTSVENYFIDNPDDIPSYDTPTKYYLNDIISKGYIDNIKDPNGANCNDLEKNSYVLVIRDTDSLSSYKLDYITCLICKKENKDIYISDDCNSFVTIMLNANGGTNIEPSIKIEKYSATYGELPILTKNGYEFLGWYTEENGGVKIEANTVFNYKKSATTLYAHWKVINYAITYNLDGGTVSGNPASYNIETDTFTLNKPTKDGYIFAGWTGSNGSTRQKSVTISKGSTGNKTYTANWKDTNNNALVLGDYFTLVPDVKTYIVSSSVTGYSSDQTINIAGTSDSNGLRLWRVIDVHNDGSVDAVSEYVSKDLVYFKGTIGYQYNVSTLQLIASQYAKAGYTIGTRMMGYGGQTPVIQTKSSTCTDTTCKTTTTYAFDESTNAAPTTTSTPTPTTGTGEEYLGGVGGDTLYLKDYKLVGNLYKTNKKTYGTTGLRASDPSGTVKSYWIASRRFIFITSVGFRFNGRYVDPYCGLGDYIIRYFNDRWYDSGTSYSFRPIITLKSGIGIIDGFGTKDDPYTLN